MISIDLLSTRALSRMAKDLEQAGYQVFEALDVSEVLHLCEHHNIDAVVIGADIDEPDVIEVQLREITIKLKAEATVKDLVWELSNLFPDKTVRIQ